MILTTPNIIGAVLVALVVFLIGFLLWRKLHQNEALKYEFITIIAHKFRTPLSRIKWLLGDLVKSEPDSFKRENLVSLQKENENLVKLIDTLVQLTDAPGTEKLSYKFERIDLCEFVRAVFETANRSFQEKNISVSINCPEQNVFVKVDRSRMEFVITTLLDNACLYTPPGRTAAVTVTAKWRKAAISVMDDGIGISPLDMQRMFTRFFRAKNAQTVDTEGLGVALYLADSIVKRHHGRLNAFSAGTNTGSTFSVILPRVK